MERLILASFPCISGLRNHFNLSIRPPITKELPGLPMQYVNTGYFLQNQNQPSANTSTSLQKLRVAGRQVLKQLVPRVMGHSWGGKSWPSIPPD